MSPERGHRGAHPEDARLFAPAAVAKLRTACEEAAYLLSRGYAERSVVDVVGRRHELEARQRLALQRSMCSEAQRTARLAKRVEASRARGQRLAIDGFNLIIGLEVALSGGVLLRGYDQALRDLAGLRGSYRLVAETERALELIAELAHELRPAELHFLLDAPVSNSGRLRACLLEHASAFALPVTVDLVPDPDRELARREYVVSSDALVLDRAESVVDLLTPAVARVPGAWVVELG